MNKIVKIFAILAVLILLTIPSSAASYSGQQDVKLVPGGELSAVGLIPGIETIALQEIISTDFFATFYDYKIIVNGACPAGLNSIKMYFEDESGDVYVLNIIDSDSKSHVLRYHSSHGNIKSIAWTAV